MISTKSYLNKGIWPFLRIENFAKRVSRGGGDQPDTTPLADRRYADNKRLFRRQDPGVRAFSFPLIILAQEGLMFLALPADFSEGHLHAGKNVGAFSGGMQRARGKREVHGEGVGFLSRMLFDIRMQQHQVR